jgi:hypothetical protein
MASSSSAQPKGSVAGVTSRMVDSPAHSASMNDADVWNTEGQGSVDLLLDWPEYSANLNPIENVQEWQVGSNGLQQL